MLGVLMWFCLDMVTRVKEGHRRRSAKEWGKEEEKARPVIVFNLHSVLCFAMVHMCECVVTSFASLVAMVSLFFSKSSGKWWEKQETNRTRQTKEALVDGWRCGTEAKTLHYQAELRLKQRNKNSVIQSSNACHSCLSKPNTVFLVTPAS